MELVGETVAEPDDDASPSTGDCRDIAKGNCAEVEAAPLSWRDATPAAVTKLAGPSHRWSGVTPHVPQLLRPRQAMVAAVRPLKLPGLVYQAIGPIAPPRHRLDRSYKVSPVVSHDVMRCPTTRQAESGGGSAPPASLLPPRAAPSRYLQAQKGRAQLGTR